MLPGMKHRAALIAAYKTWRSFGSRGYGYEFNVMVWAAQAAELEYLKS
jgi:hypothetical protein